MIKIFALAALTALMSSTTVQAQMEGPRIPNMADACPPNAIATDGSRLPIGDRGCYGRNVPDTETFLGLSLAPSRLRAR